MKYLKLIVFGACLLVSGTTTGRALPVLPLQYGMTTDSVSPQKDSIQTPVRERGEGASKTAKASAWIAAAAAVTFAILPFPARTGFAVIFLFACLFGGVSGLAALMLSKPKTRAKRRGGLALLFILAMFGIAAIIALKALDQG